MGKLARKTFIRFISGLTVFFNSGFLFSNPTVVKRRHFKSGQSKMIKFKNEHIIYNDGILVVAKNLLMLGVIKLQTNGDANTL